MEQTIQTAMAELLGALGFATMAEEVLGETERDRLARYARLIVRQTQDARTKTALLSRFRALNLA